MKMSCIVRVGISAVSMIVAAGLGVPSCWAQTAAPRYEVDVTFPQRFPDRWVTGGFGGHCIDAQDHVLLLNRQDVLDGELNAGRLAPLMIELDPTGKVVHSWGDPNLIEGTVAGLRNGPTAFRLHTCQFDKDGNVWIASSPGGMIQKYTHDGSKLLQQIGRKGVFDTSDGTIKGTPLNSNAARFTSPASIQVDRQNGDIYVADGESRGGNSRVLVPRCERQFPAPVADHRHGLGTLHGVRQRWHSLCLQSLRQSDPALRQDGEFQEDLRLPVEACDRAGGRQDRAKRRRHGRARFLPRSRADLHF